VVPRGRRPEQQRWVVGGYLIVGIEGARRAGCPGPALLQQGDWDGAERANQLAIHSGHAAASSVGKAALNETSRSSREVGRVVTASRHSVTRQCPDFLRTTMTPEPPIRSVCRRVVGPARVRGSRVLYIPRDCKGA
jgi:hypothetical protein